MSNQYSENPEEIEIDESHIAPVQDGQQVCAQCQAAVPQGTGVATDSAIFCDECFDALTEALNSALSEQGQNINYLGALAGGLLGGSLAAGVWWGFTVLTNIQFGLVAVLIGWAVGKGVVALSGDKRALPLQLMSVAITLVSYSLASYWVTRTFVHRYIAENGLSGSLPMLPTPALLGDVLASGFEIWDLIFVAIALWQAWKMPAPIVLGNSE
jgi:hypothetical protein